MTDAVDVAIVGAGAAGIGAARRLANADASYIIAEASPRVGGRALTQDISGRRLDLGCGWLHSADRNSLSKAAEEAGFAIDRGPSAWGTQFGDLGFTPGEQAAARGAFTDFTTSIETTGPQAIAPRTP
jgi:monoamine oxidase